MRPRKKNHLDRRMEACDSVLFKVPHAFPSPDAPLRLELGCGKGKFICALAASNPQINFIAIEREPNVAVIAAETIFRADPPLPNLLLLVDDAEKLPLLFSKGELERIYINFCDPWHKHGQFKRRLTHRDRLLVYRELLAPGGELQFKTDDYMLYHFSTFEFDAVMPPYFKTTDLHADIYAADNIMTEYETRFSELGQPIYALRAKKDG